MKDLINSFEFQLKQALEIGEAADLKRNKEKIKTILICGMGGSGIGGTILSNIISSSSSVPLFVLKDYSIPNFVNKNTLFIACSYSGNTEETISSLNLAIEKKAQIACVTSGGKLLDLAKKKSFNYIKIPGGNPPRAMFGFSFIQLFYLLLYFEIIDASFKKEIKTSIDLIAKEKKQIVKKSQKIAALLDGKCPIIYSAPNMEGVAIRFRQQINENSKMLAWHHSVPEMNHNELVGWRKKDKNLSVIFLRNESDFYRIKERIELNKKEISKYCSRIIEIWSKGESLIEQSLYLIHLTDWVSLFLAEKSGIDPVEVNVISLLKNKLGDL